MVDFPPGGGCDTTTTVELGEDKRPTATEPVTKAPAVRPPKSANSKKPETGSTTADPLGTPSTETVTEASRGVCGTRPEIFPPARQGVLKTGTGGITVIRDSGEVPRFGEVTQAEMTSPMARVRKAECGLASSCWSALANTHPPFPSTAVDPTNSPFRKTSTTDPSVSEEDP